MVDSTHDSKRRGSTASVGTVQRKKRGRAAKACIRCRIAKAKCEFAEGATRCEKCTSKDYECNCLLPGQSFSEMMTNFQQQQSLSQSQSQFPVLQPSASKVTQSIQKSSRQQGDSGGSIRSMSSSTLNNVDPMSYDSMVRSDQEDSCRLLQFNNSVEQLNSASLQNSPVSMGSVHSHHSVPYLFGPEMVEQFPGRHNSTHNGCLTSSSAPRSGSYMPGLSSSVQSADSMSFSLPLEAAIWDCHGQNNGSIDLVSEANDANAERFNLSSVSQNRMESHQFVQDLFMDNDAFLDQFGSSSHELYDSLHMNYNDSNDTEVFAPTPPFELSTDAEDGHSRRPLTKEEIMRQQVLFDCVFNTQEKLDLRFHCS